MKLEGADFSAVLADAQKQGYAETPPDLDIDGHDAAHKIGILASLAHGFWVNPKKIHVEGIRHISASTSNLRVSWVIRSSCWESSNELPIADCRCRFDENPKSEIRNPKSLSGAGFGLSDARAERACSRQCEPRLQRRFVRGDIVGDTLFYGRGAGKDATASAVLSDLADAALDLKSGSKQRVPPFVPHECAGAVAPR